MRKPPKIHYFDYEGNRKVPEWDENKMNGYRIAICGYQRKIVRLDPKEINCKLCLREMKLKGV